MSYDDLMGKSQETAAESEEIRLVKADVVQVCLYGAIALLNGVELVTEMLRAERQGDRRCGRISITDSKTGAPLEVANGGGFVSAES